MKKNIIIFPLLTLSSLISMEASTYLVQLSQTDAKIVIKSSYDQFGFDKDGNHKDGGTSDQDGFNNIGIKDDINSSIDQTLNNKLLSSQEYNIAQDVNEGNFTEFNGSFSFDKEIITLINQDSKVSYLKSTENTNSYPNNIEVIKNGSIINSTYISSDFIQQEPIYEDVTSTYWTTPVNRGNINTFTALSGNGSYSLTQSAATKTIGYTLSVNTSNSGRTKSYLRVAQNNHISYYEYNNRYQFRYSFSYWDSHQRTTTNNVLTGYNNTNYSEYSNANIGDEIEILKPIKLEYSTDNISWTEINTTRDNITESKLNFNIDSVDTQNINFRLTDQGHSYSISTLKSFVVNLKNKR